MNGSQASVRALERAGTRVIFGHPGGAILPFYDALYDSTIDHVLVRHEQNAAHMADGYARMSGHAGVCVSTSGPGATNMLTGIATARMDSSPVVALTGQVATESLGADAFQEVDAYGMFMPVVKHNWRIHDTAHVERVIAEAFQVANRVRQGPVHVDLPLDIQRADAPENPPKHTSQPTQNPSPDPKSVLEAIKAVEQAERPVILLGGGARASRCPGDLLALAELLGAGVVTTLMGKGAVPEDHPLVLGPVGMHGKLAATHTLHEADTVVALGARFSDRSVSAGDSLERRVVHVDADSSEVGKRIKGVVGVVGELNKVVAALISGLKTRTRRRATPWRERVAQWKKECSCDFDLPGEPIKPQRLIKELNRGLPDDVIFTTDVGRHQMWAEHFLEIRGKRRFITSGGLGTMGFGLPAAIGAKAAVPDCPTVVLAGDGSFQMTLKELVTARENELPVGVVVFNDGLLGMVHQWQDLFYSNRYKGVALGTLPDFVGLARSYGCDGTRVERSSELPEALERMQESTVPFVVDVVIDAKEGLFPFVQPGKSYRDAMVGPRCTWKTGLRKKGGDLVVDGPAPA